MAARRSFVIGFANHPARSRAGVDQFRHPQIVAAAGSGAQRFIDFMLDGATAADVSSPIGAGNPNAAAVPHIRPGWLGASALSDQGRQPAGNAVDLDPGTAADVPPNRIAEQGEMRRRYQLTPGQCD